MLGLAKHFSWRLLLSLWLVSAAGLTQASEKLNGLALHSELSQEQFIAALFVDELSDNARSVMLSPKNKVMELRILADKIYPRRFKQMWVEGLAINSGSSELGQFATSLSDFSKSLKVKLRAGDVLRIEQSVSNVVIKINGYTVEKLDDPRFFDLLLRTWIGPVPLSSEFKEALLADGKIDQELLQRFEQIQPSSARIQAVSSALEAAEQKAQAAATPTPKAAAQASSAAQAKPKPVVKAPAKSSSSKAAVAEAKPKSSSKAAQSSSAAAPGLVKEDDLFDDDILDDEEDDLDFSAEALLSKQLYYSKLTKWTANFVEYPRRAMQRNLEGTVRVSMTLKRNGRVVKIDFMELSPHEDLNKAAEQAVRNASPYPAIPDDISGDELVFTIPVVFRLR